MLRALLLVTTLSAAMPPSSRAEDPVEVIFEEVGKLNSQYARGLKIYMISNVDFALCYHPGVEKVENMSGEWAADVIRLDPGKEKVFIGKWMADEMHESWSFHLGGRFSTECL